MKIDELITPAVLVDGAVLKRNVERMQKMCAEKGIHLRPHVKSHNYPEIAKMQMAAGARGITVATLREAELMIQSGESVAKVGQEPTPAFRRRSRSYGGQVGHPSAGGELMRLEKKCLCSPPWRGTRPVPPKRLREGGSGGWVRNDIFIAREIVDFAGLRRLAELTNSAQMSVAIDSAEGLRRLSQIMTEVQTRVGVLIEIDTGGRRCGLASETEVCALAQLAKRSPGIDWRGIFTHEGHVYSASSREEMIKISAEVVERMSELYDILTKKQLAPDVVSIGSSPSLKLLADRRKITEARPGNYVFNDAMQLANGSAGLEDCALKVMATVISKPASDRVILNVGSKLLGSDRGSRISDSGGFGLVIDPCNSCGRAGPRVERGKQPACQTRGMVPPPLKIAKIYEEHAVIEEASNPFAVGQNVIFVPSHACMAANLAREIYVTDAGGKVIDCWSNQKMKEDRL